MPSLQYQQGVRVYPYGAWTIELLQSGDKFAAKCLEHGIHKKTVQWQRDPDLVLHNAVAKIEAKPIQDADNYKASLRNPSITKAQTAQFCTRSEAPTFNTSQASYSYRGWTLIITQAEGMFFVQLKAPFTAPRHFWHEDAQTALNLAIFTIEANKPLHMTQAQTIAGEGHVNSMAFRGTGGQAFQEKSALRTENELFEWRERLRKEVESDPSWLGHKAKEIFQGA